MPRTKDPRTVTIEGATLIEIDTALIQMNTNRLGNTLRAEEGLPPKPFWRTYEPFRASAFNRLILEHGLDASYPVIGAARDRLIVLHVWWKNRRASLSERKDALRRLHRLYGVCMEQPLVWEEAVRLSDHYTLRPQSAHAA